MSRIFYKVYHNFQTSFQKKLMIEKLSKRDNHKILSVAQQKMKLVSDLASLVKYCLFNGSKKTI